MDVDIFGDVAVGDGAVLVAADDASDTKMSRDAGIVEGQMAHGAALADPAEESLGAIHIAITALIDSDALHGMAAAVKMSLEIRDIRAVEVSDRRIVILGLGTFLVCCLMLKLDIPAEREVRSAILIGAAVHLLRQQLEAAGAGDGIGFRLAAVVGFVAGYAPDVLGGGAEGDVVFGNGECAVGIDGAWQVAAAVGLRGLLLHEVALAGGAVVAEAKLGAAWCKEPGLAVGGGVLHGRGSSAAAGRVGGQMYHWSGARLGVVVGRAADGDVAFEGDGAGVGVVRLGDLAVAISDGCIILVHRHDVAVSTVVREGFEVAVLNRTFAVISRDGSDIIISADLAAEIEAVLDGAPDVIAGNAAIVMAITGSTDDGDVRPAGAAADDGTVAFFIVIAHDATVIVGQVFHCMDVDIFGDVAVGDGAAPVGAGDAADIIISSDAGIVEGHVAHGAALANLAEESLVAIHSASAALIDSDALHSVAAAVEMAFEVIVIRAVVVSDRRIVILLAVVFVTLVLVAIRNVPAELEELPCIV